MFTFAIMERGTCIQQFLKYPAFVVLCHNFTCFVSISPSHTALPCVWHSFFKTHFDKMHVFVFFVVS